MEKPKTSFAYETKPTAKELWKFSMIYAYKGIRAGVNIILVGGSLFLLLTRWEMLELFRRLMLLFIIFLFVLWQPAMLYLKSLRQARELEKQPPLLLKFTQEGVDVAQGEEGGHVAWEDIGRIEIVGGMVIVYGDRVHASLIPLSVIGKDEDALRSLIREKLPKVRRKGI